MTLTVRRCLGKSIGVAVTADGTVVPGILVRCPRICFGIVAGGSR